MSVSTRSQPHIVNPETSIFKYRIYLLFHEAKEIKSNHHKIAVLCCEKNSTDLSSIRKLIKIKFVKINPSIVWSLMGWHCFTGAFPIPWRRH